VDPLITAIVLNYHAEAATLGRCMGSLAAQTYGRLEILLVDNGSRPGALEAVTAAHADVRLLRLDRNYGFSGGMNRGIRAASGQLVLLLNFDVELEPTCVAELVKVIQEDERTVGVAPKTVFMHDRHLIDNVGTLINGAGAAYNMGIGQLDVGQYDVGERVFGACFAAALFRKAAFAEDAVGPLDERYFMYYEDVDWCYRANLLGWHFRTAPRAVVAHVHSASVRHLDYSFKYYLIERNLLRTIVKNFETRRALRVLARRTLTHLAKALRRQPFWTTGLRAMARAWLELPRLWSARSRLQRRRVVDDREILRFSFGELSHFDPVGYAPLYVLDTLEAMYRRLGVVTGERRPIEIARALQTLCASKLRFEPDFRARRAGEILRGEPDFVLEFVDKMKQ
jgi:GT2 family glycosyltransferase